MAARLFGPELERLSADDQDKVRDLLLARVERDLMEPPVMRRRSGAVFSNFELGLYQPDRAIVTYIFRGADKKRSVEDLYLRLTKGKWSIVDFGNDSGWFTEREGVLFQKSGKTPLAYAQRWRR